MDITILGGTGFVGLSIINCLAKTDSNITVITRNREKNKKILVYPQVRLIEADVNNAEELIKHTKKTDVLINLIGILTNLRHRRHPFQSLIVSYQQVKADLRLMNLFAL